MRYLTWMGLGLGLAGLALVAPTAVLADPPASKPSAGKKTKPKPTSFHRSHLCAQCQWAEMRSKGINVPPPPRMPQGGQAVPGTACDRCGVATSTYSVPSMVSAAAPPPPPVTVMSARSTGDVPPPPVATVPGAPGRGGMAGPAADCVACAAAAGPVMIGPDGAPMMVAGGGEMPGRAVVGGGAPGYASVSGGMVVSAEPMPIGMVQGQYAYQNPGAAMGPAAMPMAGGRPGAIPGPGRPGWNDPSVMPSSFAPDTITAGQSGRPHVVSHLFGFDAIGRRRREDRERRERENHAAISYQPQGQQPVVELPSSMVYGR
jgi:hypothetical protein